MRNCGSEEYYRTHASCLTDQLYLAACRAVTSKCLLDLGITSIVNATLELPTVAYQKQDTIQIAVEDRVTAKLNIYFDLIADKIQQVHHGGGKILIYCRAGQSRSATLCIAYFMKYHNMTYEQAFQYVKYRRPIIHPNVGFVHQLKDYERRLQSKPAPAPLQVKYAEESVLDEDIIEDETVDVPIAPLKHGRGNLLVHEPFKTLTDKYEIVSVQVCDKNSFRAKRPIPERVGASIQDGHPVASSWTAPRTHGAVKEYNETQARGKRKTAFTRMTKPNEIAVSYWNIPLDLALASNINGKFKLQTNPEYSSLALAELHLHLAVFEGQPHELVGNVSETLMKPVKATKVLTMLRQSVTQFSCDVLDTNGTISFSNPKNVSIKEMPSTNKITRQLSVKSRSLLRFGNSYQVQPKLQQAPSSSRAASSQKPLEATLKVTIDDPVRAVLKLSDNVRHCAISKIVPILWENVSNRDVVKNRKIVGRNVRTYQAISDKSSNVGEMSLLAQKPVTVLKQRHSISRLSTQTWSTTVAIPTFTIPLTQYHKLDFSFAPYETTNIVSGYIQTVVGVCVAETGGSMVLNREFPYYSTVHFTSALELFRASENVKLDIQWFKAPQTSKLDRELELIRKSSEARMAERRKKASEIVVKWATERFQPDEFQTSLPCLSLAHSNRQTYIASLCLHPQIHDSYILHEVIDYFKLDLIGRFFVPKHDPHLLRKCVDHVPHPSAVILSFPVMESTGKYSPQNRPSFKAVARRNLHTDCKIGAVTQIADTHNAGDYLEDIPDEINDISEMKNVLAEKTDSPRCKIWFEVFKRTLMLKRPTFPTIGNSHFLQTSVNSEHCLLEFVIAGSSNSSKLKVNAKFSASPSLNVASIGEVKIIEKISNSSKTAEKFQRFNAKQSRLKVISSIDCIVSSENIVYEDAKMMPAVGNNFVKPVSKVSFPNRLYCVQQEQVYGLTERLVLGARELTRVPFSVVTRLRGVAEIIGPLVTLGNTIDLPEYKFVQVR